MVADTELCAVLVRMYWLDYRIQTLRNELTAMETSKAANADEYWRKSGMHVELCQQHRDLYARILNMAPPGIVAEVTQQCRSEWAEMEGASSAKGKPDLTLIANQNDDHD